MQEKNKNITKTINLNKEELASIIYAVELTLKTIKQLLDNKNLKASTKNTICEISTGLITALTKLR